MPDFGYATSINAFGEIGFEAGLSSAEDIFLAERVGATPTLRLQINGARPEPPVVNTPATTHLTLDVKPGTFVDPVDWYFALSVYGTGEWYWFTSTGVSTTPGPLLRATPPLALDAVTLFDVALPESTVVSFVFFLYQGQDIVALDYTTSITPPWPPVDKAARRAAPGSP